MKIFYYIKAKNFFPKYAPLVKDWAHKVNGKNGRGNPIKFTSADRGHITAGLRDMVEELTKD